MALMSVIRVNGWNYAWHYCSNETDGMGCDGMEEMRCSLLLADPHGLLPLLQMYVGNQFPNYPFGVVL